MAGGAFFGQQFIEKGALLGMRGQGGGKGEHQTSGGTPSPKPFSDDVELMCKQKIHNTGRRNVVFRQTHHVNHELTQPKPPMCLSLKTRPVPQRPYLTTLWDRERAAGTL